MGVLWKTLRQTLSASRYWQPLAPPQWLLAGCQESLRQPYPLRQWEPAMNTRERAWSSKGIEKHHLPFLEYFLSPWYILTIPTVYVPLHLVLDGECLAVCFQVASLCISLAGSDRYCFLMWCHCSFWVSDVDSCSDEKVWTSHVPSSGIMGHAHHV